MPKLPSQITESIFRSFKEGRISKSDYETFSGVYDPVMDNRQEAMDALRVNADRKKYLATLGAAKFDELGAKMDDQESGSTFMSNLISPAFKANSSEVNIDMRKQSIYNLLNSDLGEMNKAISTRLSKKLNPFAKTAYDQKAQDDLIDAIIDPNANVDPEYKAMAAQWNKANKQALEMHRAAGGDMKEINTDGGYLPQTHDESRMQQLPDGYTPTSKKGTDSRLIEDAKVSKDRWINFTKKNIDYDKMNLTHKSAKEIEEILSEVYETITSGGLNKVKKALANKIKNLKKYEEMLKANDPDAALFKKEMGIEDGESAADYYRDFTTQPMTANQRQAHRELHFTAPGYKSYQKMYGKPDVYKTISDYLEGMSMDIASMQVMGPNPAKTFTKLKEKAAIEGKETGSQGHLKGMFDVATGATDSSKAATDAEQQLESFWGGFRSIGVAADLGGAVISSLTDPIFTASTKAHLQMGTTSYFKTFTNEIYNAARLIANSLNKTEREIYAQRLGITNDMFMADIRNNRFSEGGGSKKLQKIADTVLRASGLTAMTNARRTTFGLELNAFMADHVGKSLDSFEFGKQLKETYGITDSDWKRVTSKYLTPASEGKYLDITRMYMDEPEISLRLLDIINQETNYAVIMPDSRVRSITTGGGQAKGTIKGEAARTMLMYKSFPISVMTTHLGRFLGMGSTSSKVKYGANILVMGTMAGMGVVQLKEMMKGREPIPVDDMDQMGNLALKGFLQSGGLGIIGDLIFSDATRYGGGMVSSVIGKVGQPLEDLDKLKKLYQKDDTNAQDIASELFDISSKYVPGRNLWYTRLIYERAIKDQMQKLIDPDYDKKLRKHMRKLNKETGQGYWAPPGEIPFKN